MTSTGFNVGLSNDKSSSRVLKPPGGGHSNIFDAPEPKAAQPRAKYDQQNSTNLNFCMNTVDPNVLVSQQKQSNPVESIVNASESVKVAPAPVNNITGPPPPQQQPKGRVPPGGFSNGLW